MSFLAAGGGSLSQPMFGGGRTGVVQANPTSPSVDALAALRNALIAAQMNPGNAAAANPVLATQLGLAHSLPPDAGGPGGGFRQGHTGFPPVPAPPPPHNAPGPPHDPGPHSPGGYPPPRPVDEPPPWFHGPVLPVGGQYGEPQMHAGTPGPPKPLFGPNGILQPGQGVKPTLRSGTPLAAAAAGPRGY